ncbi:hypothetical protein M0804_014524 [Polistes exclamans]|nr:hypothetical protein M0804_014525 [Polistes exclamans]KAI4475085.1 hypothetical protein M0804_014524 [Polistes exclamans]
MNKLTQELPANALKSMLSRYSMERDPVAKPRLGRLSRSTPKSAVMRSSWNSESDDLWGWEGGYGGWGRAA